MKAERTPMVTDTPRTNALLTELAIYKETSFEHIVKLTKQHVEFTRKLEREAATLQRRLERIEGSQDQLLEDAARKIVRVYGNGQPKQLDDAVLLIRAALKSIDASRLSNLAPDHCDLLRRCESEGDGSPSP
jgi:hypothetical protein